MGLGHETRPDLDKVLDQLRPGDTLVVWNSTGSADPSAIWSTLSPASTRGRWGFRSLQESIDTTTPSGKLVQAAS